MKRFRLFVFDNIDSLHQNNNFLFPFDIRVFEILIISNKIQTLLTILM